MAPRRKNNNYYQIERQIIEFLKQGSASYKEIFTYVGSIPKSSFSNIINGLIKNDVVSVSGKSYSLNGTKAYAGSALKQHQFREWIILLVLNLANGPIPLKDIFAGYKNIVSEMFVIVGDDCADSLSEAADEADDELQRNDSSIKTDEMLDKPRHHAAENINDAEADDEKSYEDSVKQGIRISLKRLADGGLVEVTKAVGNKLLYSPSSSAPHICQVDFLEMEMLHSYIECFDASNTTGNLAQRINMIVGGLDQCAASKYGKQNAVIAAEIDTLNHLIDLPYKNKKIEITRDNGKSNIIDIGIIIYSEETNEFYIIGNDGDVTKNIRVGSIVSMKATDQDNTLFENEWFLNYKDERFGVDGGEVMDVTVRFRNTAQVEEKIARLAQLRKNAKIDWNYNDGKEILFRDRIRGLEAFARYLRGFGSDVIVDGPEELRNRMLMTVDYLDEIYR